MSLISTVRLNFADRLKKDRGFRRKFFRTSSQQEVAEQIRELRSKRHMRQTDLAKAAQMKQSAVSRLEQAHYCRWNFTTLLRVADSLRARVRVVFEAEEDVFLAYERADQLRAEMALMLEATPLQAPVREPSQLKSTQLSPSSIVDPTKAPGQDYLQSNVAAQVTLTDFVRRPLSELLF
jgi:DNA-binding XRE family transcriptional regulator